MDAFPGGAVAFAGKGGGNYFGFLKMISNTLDMVKTIETISNAICRCFSISDNETNHDTALTERTCCVLILLFLANILFLCYLIPLERLGKGIGM